MTVVRVKHVQSVRGADGRTRHYHRQTRERLPDEPEARARRVLEINAGLAAPTKRLAVPGTFADLIAAYRASADYRSRAANTRRDYERHLASIAEAWGALPVRDLRRKHVRAMRDKLGATPRTANYRMQVLSLLIAFGIDIDSELYAAANPVARLKKLALPGEGYQPWPDEVVERFRAAAYPELRRIVLGGILGTGQRPGDVVAMQSRQIGAEQVQVRQHKTGTVVLIPRSAELSAALAEIETRVGTVFLTRTGKPWSERYLANEVRRVMAPLGYSGYSPHGLRVTWGMRAALAGVDMERIGAVLGHRSARMIAHYVRHATLAQEAFMAVEANAFGTANCKTP